MSKATTLACLLVAAVSLTFPAVVRADFPHDARLGGLDVTPITGDQQSPSMVPDGAGGFIVTWNDSRNFANTGYDIYAQRFDAYGRPQWAANGVPVCTADGSQNLPLAVSDGAGGAVILWRDDRPTSAGYYAQRLNRSGVPQWGANGVLGFLQTHTDYGHHATTDGAGGIWFVATRDSAGISQFFIQHVTAAGAVPLGTGGVPGRINQPVPTQAVITTDRAGGSIVAWVELRNAATRLFMQHYGATGAEQWNPTGLNTVFGIAGTSLPQVESDGQGGAFVACLVATTSSILAQHVTDTGQLRWDSATVPVQTTAVLGDVLQIAPDGQDGLLIGWHDVRRGFGGDATVQRLSPQGLPLWAVNGTHLTSVVPGTQFLERIVPDGRGGGYFVFGSEVSGQRQIVAQRLDSFGNAMFDPNGVPFTATSQVHSRSTAVADDDGGIFAAWDTSYPFSFFDLSVNRLDRYGLLGANGPRLTSVKDVPHDQGGHVKLSWDAAWLDSDTSPGVTEYRVWRSVATAGPAALVSAPPIVLDSDEAAANGWWLADAATAAIAWELVGSQPAALLPSYSFVAPTPSDSVAGSVPWTGFRVEAVATTASSVRHWWSAADSAYSVDNLPPAAPAAFAATYASGSTLLAWNANLESDLAGYRLYRGSSLGFTIGPATKLADLTANTFVDASPLPHIYKLTAVDAHGNESAVAVVVPVGVLGVDDAAAPRLSFAAPSPSPARDRTTLRWSLARAGRVRLSLEDVAGRSLRTLFAGEQPAGPHALAFECKDAAGRALAAGLYFVQLEVPGARLTRKLFVVR